MAAYTTIDDSTAYFQTVLYTGNGQARDITFDGNSDMQPDWVWGKIRTQTYSHRSFDSVRGTGKGLHNDTNEAEFTQNANVSAFNSDGFSLGNDNGMNSDGDTHVAWNWKAGTSVSGNTTGSGTAKAYTGSVSTTAGFSIIRYLGNGTDGHTIPHHLGVTPKMIIVKSTAGSQSWIVLPPVTDGHDKDLKLDDTSVLGDSDVWNNVAPSSTVFSVGSNAVMNANDVALISYSFAEKQGYSKFSSYTGNGNADGTFVYTGFKPAFFMIKRTTGSGYDWLMYDNKRQVSFNVIDDFLNASSNAAETTGNANQSLDFLSNGVKHRGNGASSNGDGVVYIYMAFAENPFTTSTGVPGTAR